MVKSRSLMFLPIRGSVLPSTAELQDVPPGKRQKDVGWVPPWIFPHLFVCFTPGEWECHGNFMVMKWDFNVMSMGLTGISPT